MIFGYLPFMTYCVLSCSFSSDRFWNCSFTKQDGTFVDNCQDGSLDSMRIFYEVLLILMTIYTLIKLYGELYEIKSKCCSYFLNFSNLLDLLLILILVYTILASLQLTYGIEVGGLEE